VRAGQAAGTRTLQGIYRGGFEMLYRRTPMRQNRHSGTGRTLRQCGPMRILSSPTAVESAELVARTIIDTYLEPNRPFWNYGRWRTAGQSISCVISARPAAQNSSRFALNSESRYELENCSELALSGGCLKSCPWSNRTRLDPILPVIVACRDAG
jgi:hypothetical protein